MYVFFPVIFTYIGVVLSRLAIYSSYIPVWTGKRASKMSDRK